MPILNHFRTPGPESLPGGKLNNHKKGYDMCSLTNWNVLAHAKVISMIGGGIRPD